MSISHADFAYNRPGSLRDAAVAGWFLGPKGENKEVLSDLFTQALDEHVSFRNQYFPEDPYYITDEVKEQPAYVGAVAKLRDESQKLFQRLKNSVPFYSMRYQGHMLWDITMPGMVGYHAAMFYNQNNTAVEASPVTTALEYRVGFDLAKMLGYQVGDSIDGSSGLPKAGPKSSHLDEAALAPEKTPQPWGHVTCDGTVANLESLWAARNLKYFPLSFQMALKNPALASASNFTVPVWDIATGKKKNRKVLSLSTWELLNLDVDDVLALTERLSSPPYNISSQIISDAMAPYNIQYAGISELHRLFGIRKTPVYIVTQSCHYSWPKAGSVLGLGMNNMIKIPVDKKGRMDMNSLHKTLTDLVSPADPADRTAVIMVMGIAGSTEESCVDPIADILSMRKEFQTKLGFSYYVHCDGAWGGYFCSTMRKDDSTPPQPTDHIESFLHACNEGEGSSSSANAAGYVPFLPLSRYTETQLNALSHCDSITIDPHKSGYIQYPAGGLVYRNGTTRTLITFDAPIVYKGQGDQTIGIYGIEGSKPGAAASACYLSHRVIGLNRNGYGRILGQANFSTKKMYCMLNTLAQEDDPFIIRTFTDFPKPLVDDHGSVKGLLEYLQKHVVDRTNSQIAQDSRAMETMRQLGPDLLINAFAINFKVPAPSSSDGEGSSSSSMHHMSNGDSSMDMSCGPSHLVLNRDIDKANAVMTNLFNDLDMAYMVVDPDGGPAAPIQKYGVMRKPLFFTSSEFGSNKYGMAVDDLKKRLGFDPEEDTPLYFLVNTTMDPWQTSVQFTKMVARILRANILKSIGTVTDTPDTHGFLLVGQKTLYFKHFPMFCAPPHQYMITIRVDFSNDEDRKKYLDKQKEDPNKVLVLANHDESILHDIVYRDPTSPLPVDCYFGMPPTGPPTVPFMEAALLIKDFIIYEHFDVKAQYPERLTYLMYGTGDEVHIEHYISKMKSFDHVCTLAAPPCGIDEERFKAGMFIQFNKPDGYYTENPLKEQDEWEFTYAGDGGVELNSKLTIARHIWFDPNRVNVMD